MPILERLADAWVSRVPGDAGATSEARAAVAHLKPAAVVTGGSRGIGLAIAGLLAARGRDTVLVARDAARLDQAAAGVLQRTSRAPVTIALDLTAPGAADRLSARLSECGFYADMLVNNAAVGLAGPFAGAPAGDLAHLNALNVAAPALLINRMLPDMLARRQGGILNIASLGGVVPGPNQAAYYASKAYMLSLTEALAAEYGGQGVRICVVAPGPADTGFHAGMGAQNSLYRVLIPALDPQRVARAALRGFAAGRVLVVPGLVNRLMYGVLRALPHPITVPFVEVLLRRRGQ